MIIKIMLFNMFLTFPWSRRDYIGTDKRFVLFVGVAAQQLVLDLKHPGVCLQATVLGQTVHLLNHTHLTDGEPQEAE